MEKYVLDAVGSDPEIFLINEEGKGVPSEQYFKGDKNSPQDRGDGFFVLCDNVMVEFNTPPSKTKEEFLSNHIKALKMIKSDLPDYINLDIVAAKHFDKSQLRSKLARTFGCMPDFDVWEECPNSSPNARTTLRTAAGHIHISYVNNNIVDSLFLAKLFDYFLGLPSLFLDEDTERRQMYGKAGAIRLKEWGFEYRVLSNFWLRSEELTNWVWEQIQLVFKFANDNPNFNFEDAKDVVDAINNYDLELAKSIMEKYKEYYVEFKKEEVSV